MADLKEYELLVPENVAFLIRKSHPLIKTIFRTGLKTIAEEPLVGKPLKQELKGLRSYRVKKYRIIYRIHKKNKILEIITIGPRRNIYEETFKILSTEKDHIN